MGMNIKNPRVEKLARELAEALGETMTSAIQHALEEKLDSLNREREVEAKRRRVRQILDEMGPPPEGVTSDHSDLYDEWGLPK